MSIVSAESLPQTFAHEADCPPHRVPKARVLHLINGEHYAGAERVQDLLALRLADYGYESAFACVKQTVATIVGL